MNVEFCPRIGGRSRKQKEVEAEEEATKRFFFDSLSAATVFAAS